MFAFCVPYIANGSGEIVFFLIALFWIIAGLLKKASEAAKRQGPQATRRPERPGGGTAPKSPSLSDFLKRIQEMSRETETPKPPRGVEPESPLSVTEMQTPQRRPPIPRKPAARPMAVPSPRLRRPKKQEEIRPLAETIELRLDIPKEAEPRASVPPLEVSPPAELAEVDAYAMTTPGERRIAQILGGPVSASAFRKGIVLSEILGPPRAMRPRRPLGPRA